MNTALQLQTVNLSIPAIDIEFFKQLAERMKWNFSFSKPGIEQGLEDLRNGKVFYAKNAEDMLNQILG